MAGGDAKGAGLGDFRDAAVELQRHARPFTFALEQFDDLSRADVAEELAELLLVMGYAVPLDERDEGCRGESGERGFVEVRVAGEIILGSGVDVREIAAATAGNQYLLSGAIIVLDEENGAPALARLDGTHQTRRASTQDDNVVIHRCTGALKVAHNLVVVVSEPDVVVKLIRMPVWP